MDPQTESRVQQAQRSLRYGLRPTWRAADRGKPAAVDAGTSRDTAIDALRGAAIVLMILDHALGFAQMTNLRGSWMEFARLSVTRFALPTFMICTGVLLSIRPLALRRWIEVTAAAVIVNLGALLAGMGHVTPEVLAMWSLVMVFSPMIRRFPICVAVVALLQAFYWQVPIPTYQPGWLAAFVCIGVLGGQGRNRELAELGAFVPAWMEPMGHRPLAWYMGHLAILGSATWLGLQAGWW